MPGAKSIVTVSLLGTGLVVIASNAAKGQAPKPRSILGLGVVYLGLAAVGDFAPQLAGPFAVLVFTGTLLTEGGGALDAVSGALTSKGNLGLADAGGQGIGSSSSSSSSSSSRSGAGAGTLTGRDLLAGPKAQGAVQWALRMRGVPYVWGGHSPSGFDCSGLMAWAYGHVGVSCPQPASTQQQLGTEVPENELLPGDLIFQGRPAHHVVMYVGNGQIIQAPHTGARVGIDQADYYLNTDPGGCRRLVAPQTASSVHQTRRPQL